MIRCKKSRFKLTPWRRSVCYTHLRDSQGWVCDPDQRTFVRSKPNVANRECVA